MSPSSLGLSHSIPTLILDWMWLWKTAPKKLHFLPGKTNSKRKFYAKQGSFSPLPAAATELSFTGEFREAFLREKMSLETFACLPLPALFF